MYLKKYKSNSYTEALIICFLISYILATKKEVVFYQLTPTGIKPL